MLRLLVCLQTRLLFPTNKQANKQVAKVPFSAYSHQFIRPKCRFPPNLFCRKCRFPPNLFRRKCRFPPNLIEKGTFVQGGNYALSAWNFRASECRAELVRTMPNAAENLEEEALQSVAIVTGYEVPGRNCCCNSAWKAVRLWRCIKCRSCRVVPSRHIVLASPFRGLRPRLLSLRSVLPSRQIIPASYCHSVACYSLIKPRR